MRHLEGRVAAVTGAASGIGRATATALAKRGCKLALADVDPDGLAATAYELAADCSTHVVDVSEWEQVEGFASEVRDRHGACHVLVNNAGVTAAGRFEDDPLEVASWVMDINLWGVIHGCKAFLPILREQPEAHIVNLSSMVGLLGLPQNAVYSMSKGAVRAFSEALRSELVGTPIGLTTVFPGSIRTNIMRSARGTESERLARMADTPAAKYLLRSPDAVARSILRGIERNRARAVVGVDAHLVDLVARALPGRSGLVGRLLDVTT